MMSASHSRAVRLAFGVTVGVLASMSAAASWSAYALFGSFRQVTQAQQALARFHHIEALMESAFSGVSGYALSGEVDRLNAFHYAKIIIPRELDEMVRLSPVRREDLWISLQNQLNTRLALMARAIRLKDTRGQAASAQLLISESGSSRDQRERLLSECQQAYLQQIQTKHEALNRSAAQTQGWLALATLVSFALVGWTSFLLRKETWQRAQAETIKDQTEAMLQSVIERIPYMISVKEGQHLRVTLVNRAATEWMGMPAQNILGSLESDLRDPEEAAASMQADRTALGEARTLELHERLSRPGREALLLFTQKIPLVDAKGRPTHVLSISENITQRKQAEQMLELSRDAAVEAARLRSEFIRNMSHEFRTPLSIVMGMTSLLMDTSLTDEQRSFAQRIRRSAEGLSGLTKNILDFSKIENGSFTLENREMNVLEIAEDVRAMLAEQARVKGLALVTLASPAVPPIVRGDATRLRQVLTQLVANAVKFTDRGQISIRLSVEKQTDSQLWLRYQVTDTGIGISDDVQKYLFEPFRQGDGSWTRRYGGTGLGLAMAKRMVQLMGGQMGFESALGMGSTFWFTLPVHKRHVQGPVVQISSLPWTRARVMIVSENEVVRKMIQQQLHDCAVACEMVSSGQAAMEILRREQKAGKSFPIVLLGMHLTDMDAVHFAKLLKQDHDLKATKLALLMPETDVLDSLTATTLGFVGGVRLPCQAQELYDRLAGWIDAAEMKHPQRAA